MIILLFIILYSQYYLFIIYLFFLILARLRKANPILLRLSTPPLYNRVKQLFKETEKLFYYFSLISENEKQK